MHYRPALQHDRLAGQFQRDIGVLLDQDDGNGTAFSYCR